MSEFDKFEEQIKEIQKLDSSDQNKLLFYFLGGLSGVLELSHDVKKSDINRALEKAIEYTERENKRFAKERNE